MARLLRCAGSAGASTWSYTRDDAIHNIREILEMIVAEPPSQADPDTIDEAEAEFAENKPRPSTTSSAR
jgi:hypothetical protein